MLAFLLGTVTALLWGVGDFLVRGVSGRLGTAGALFYSHVVLIAALALSALALGWGSSTPDLWAWTLGAGGALINLAMISSVYRALHHGPLPVVAPVIASYSAVATLLAVATGTDTLRPVPALCLVVIFVGVLLAAVERDHAARAAAGRGIAWALASSVLSGTLSWAQGSVILPALGEMRALLLNGALVLAVTAPIALRQAPWSRARFDGPVVALGLCMAGGFLAFFFGLGTGEIVVVSVLSSMCGAVTALLGAVVAKQRTSKLQWAGGALILAGVVALKLA